jgi:hypothetical protein
LPTPLAPCYAHPFFIHFPYFTTKFGSAQESDNLPEKLGFSDKGLWVT